MDGTDVVVYLRLPKAKGSARREEEPKKEWRVALGEPVQGGPRVGGGRCHWRNQQNVPERKGISPGFGHWEPIADFGEGGTGCSPDKRVFLRLQEEQALSWAGSTKPEKIIMQQSGGQGVR